MWSVFFVFLSYLDRNFVKCDFLRHSMDAEKDDIFYMLNSTFCTKVSRMGDNYIHQVSDGIEEVRLVYDPVGNLVDCSMTGNHIQVKSFMYVCRLGFREQRVQPGYSVMSLVEMAEVKSNCKAFRVKSHLTKKTIKAKTAPRAQTPGEERKEENPASEETSKVKHRSKRGFTYPGTLWCGAGNIADNYDHLGEFEETDSCCRVHDHCPYVIHPFSSKFGYTNFKWHSICHCDCDNALKDCLRRVNDTSSRVVGQAFFNVIEVPCFEFTYEEQCVERHWYGVCKTYDEVPVAVTKESKHYDFGGIDVIDELTIAPRVQKDPNGEREGQGEGSTQPTPPSSQTSAPGEPSLSNVVTAAEDLIKVLATVSTSQSSSADTAKGDAQGTDKKRKHKMGKKRKTQRRKEKGKGKKRKQMIKPVSKVGEAAAAATPSCNRAEEVMDKNYFASSPIKLSHELDRKFNNFMDSILDLGGIKGVSINVTSDKSDRTPDGSSGTTATLNILIPIKELTELMPLEVEDQTGTIPLRAIASVSTVAMFKVNRRRSKEGQGNTKKRKMTSGLSVIVVNLNSLIKDEPQRTTDSPVTAATPSTTDRNTAGEPEPHRLETLTENLFLTTATTPTVTLLKAQKQKSKERRGKKKRRKITPTYSTLLVTV